MPTHSRSSPRRPYRLEKIAGIERREGMIGQRRARLARGSGGRRRQVRLRGHYAKLWGKE
jgi:hypothetical protein